MLCVDFRQISFIKVNNVSLLVVSSFNMSQWYNFGGKILARPLQSNESTTQVPKRLDSYILIL